MKRKETLILTELIIMIGVLALACGICLRALAHANIQSRDGAALDRSVAEARNVAQILRYTNGDFTEAAKCYGGTVQEDFWMIGYNGAWEITEDTPVCRLTVTSETSPIPTLGKGEIVITQENTTLFVLPVTWQRESTYEK